MICNILVRLTDFFGDVGKLKLCLSVVVFIGSSGRRSENAWGTLVQTEGRGKKNVRVDVISLGQVKYSKQKLWYVAAQIVLGFFEFWGKSSLRFLKQTVWTRHYFVIPVISIPIFDDCPSLVEVTPVVSWWWPELMFYHHMFRHIMELNKIEITDRFAAQIQFSSEIRSECQRVVCCVAKLSYHH